MYKKMVKNYLPTVPIVVPGSTSLPKQETLRRRGRRSGSSQWWRCRRRRKRRKCGTRRR
jgi:hypothetical protein